MTSELKGCVMEEQQSMSLAAAAALTSNNHLNCSLSAINHLDYDSLLMQTNTSSQKTITNKGMYILLTIQPSSNLFLQTKQQQKMMHIKL